MLCYAGNACRQLACVKLELSNANSELVQMGLQSADLERKNGELTARVEAAQAERNEARRLAGGDDSELQALRRRGESSQHQYRPALRLYLVCAG